MLLHCFLGRFLEYGTLYHHIKADLRFVIVLEPSVLHSLSVYPYLQQGENVLLLAVLVGLGQLRDLLVQIIVLILLVF